VRWDVPERVGRIRWVFLPFGLCALVAVGAHAAADVVGESVLQAVDRVDAFFDSIWSLWSFTGPLVELVGLTQRTWFARAVALIWELLADALIAVPMLGYEEREAKREWQLARELLRHVRSPLWLVRPFSTLVISAAGAFSIARMVRGSLQLALHLSWLAQLARFLTLLSLLAVLAPRAVFRSLEHARTSRYRVPAAVVLVPLLLAAAFAWR
jgi:hypothetical protein